MKILLILEAKRKDWYYYLRQDIENDYFLLWNESKSEIPELVREDSFFKGIYYWDKYLTARDLLVNIKPDRIVFFELIDQRQIALLIIANKKKITTIYLEHGASADVDGTIYMSQRENYFRNTKLNYLKKRFKTSLVKMVKSKVFYYSSLIYLNSFSSLLKFVKLPFSMLVYTPNKALQQNKFKERAPKKSIVFNNFNFESFSTYNDIERDSAVFTGIPFIDKYFNKSVSDSKYIIFIEQACLEFNLLGWTHKFHKEMALSLYNFSKKNNLKCYIRLHPTADLQLWKSYGYENPLFILSQNDDFTEELLDSELILSYSSTLLVGPLCAKKNVVLLGWHPKPTIFGMNFSNYKICHVSFSITDLEEKYLYWKENNLAIINDKNYNNFIEAVNSPFDGQASKRVISEIGRF